VKVSFDESIKNKTIAVAVSGGSDSMALLHYMLSISKDIPIKVIALNVEHGIRGASSIKDSEFVANYCKERGVPLLFYSGDALSIAEKEKISIESAGRILRYRFFKDALDKKACDFIATAHHALDNVETVLFNLFRGSALKGVGGIRNAFGGKIIRPLLSVTKQEIENYITKNGVPFVTDETNLQTDYTRNKIRLSIIPKIKEIFPELETSVNRFSTIAKEEDDYLETLAKKGVTIENQTAKIKLSLDDVLLRRAVIIALKGLGVEKDWEKSHIDAVLSLKDLKNSSKITLPFNLYAVKEYDLITIANNTDELSVNLPFNVGNIQFNGNTLKIEKVDIKTVNLKDGLYSDADKIPPSANIRTIKDGDVFTKFGGGTKKLCDYFTDLKIPKRLRSEIPLVADGNKILIIFGVAVSNNVKADQNTKTLLKFTKED
jgi:tRNA(Ile)-lysidine synthase